MGGNQQNRQRDQQPGQVNVSETQSSPAFSLPDPSDTYPAAALMIAGLAVREGIECWESEGEAER
jgi:hypothetical protein